MTGPTPGNRHQPPGLLVDLGFRLELFIDRLDRLVERVDLLDERRQPGANGLAHDDLAVVVGLALGKALQAISVARALRRDDADFAQVAAQRVEERGPLADQLLANAMAHQLRLVLHRAQRHEPLPRPKRCFADRRRVGRVGLVAPDVGLHVRRRDQFHLVPERRDLAAPMMRAPARLQRHDARREPAKELQHAAAPELANDDGLAPHVDGVNLKDMLRQIKPDARDSRQIPGKLRHGRLSFEMRFRQHHLDTLDAVGAPSTPSP